MNKQNQINGFSSLEEVSTALNQKYALITDFNTYVSGDVVKGGFYKMSYRDNLADNGCHSYYFHETFVRLTDSLTTFDQLFEYADQNIQKQLKWQKWSDEEYAKDFNKKVQYKFDYSLIVE